ncbi:hypothetical protein [Blastococcus sp. URHD0036]|uniref:hypothetical protein n=1 Tax=Blastococcus sp. URHD0036 TaxID=1380356 RepID=UPI0004962B82|nr:hypothetical protein [Blastococcus sp. URHD0036]
MLGRKDFAPDEIRRAREAADRVLRDFADAGSPAGLEDVVFTDALLALDRRFVHRIRAVAGKDGTPLNEVELIVAALVEGDGRFTTTKVIRYAPERSVLGLQPGERIEMTADRFSRLADAFLEELGEKFG